jgi:hypothetical protein
MGIMQTEPECTEKRVSIVQTGMSGKIAGHPGLRTTQVPVWVYMEIADTQDQLIL